jgi:hypothetical protein
MVVFVTPAIWEFIHRKTAISLNNADFWWHLQTGLEILRSHALPHTGWFSGAAAQPWIAPSWLYDVKIAIWYQWLGLRFLPALALTAKFFLAVLMFLLAGGLRGRFWTALALSAVAQYVLWPMPPLPVFVSVLAFAIELILLLKAWRGNRRALYFVPMLFLVWANLDFHFVYGVVALALFVVAEFVGHGREKQTPRSSTPASAKTALAGGPDSARDDKSKGILLACAAASLIATFVTPYGWKPWGVFWANATSAANRYFPDYQSLRFRTPQDYVLMLLAMAAFLWLGLRRSRNAFLIALLVLCTIAAFHSQRDAWLLGVASVAVIGSGAVEDVPLREPQIASIELAALSSEQRTSFLVSLGVSIALLLVFAVVRLPSRDAVLAQVAEIYPVQAADYIRANNLPAPLFNTFPWGGFLTWYLPQYPVAIDGRTDLYGPDSNIQYAKVMNAEAHYSTYPPLNDAGTILLEKKSVIGQAFANVPAFRVAYSDNVALVLVRDKARP